MTTASEKNIVASKMINNFVLSICIAILSFLYVLLLKLAILQFCVVFFYFALPTYCYCSFSLLKAIAKVMTTNAFWRKKETLDILAIVGTGITIKSAKKTIPTMKQRSLR